MTEFVYTIPATHQECLVALDRLDDMVLAVTHKDHTPDPEKSLSTRNKWKRAILHAVCRGDEHLEFGQRVTVHNPEDWSAFTAAADRGDEHLEIGQLVTLDNPEDWAVFAAAARGELYWRRTGGDADD